MGTSKALASVKVHKQFRQTQFSGSERNVTSVSQILKARVLKLRSRRGRRLVIQRVEGSQTWTICLTVLVKTSRTFPSETTTAKKDSRIETKTEDEGTNTEGMTETTELTTGHLLSSKVRVKVNLSIFLLLGIPTHVTKETVRTMRIPRVLLKPKTEQRKLSLVLTVFSVLSQRESSQVTSSFSIQSRRMFATD